MLTNQKKRPIFVHTDERRRRRRRRPSVPDEESAEGTARLLGLGLRFRELWTSPDSTDRIPSTLCRIDSCYCCTTMAAGFVLCPLMLGVCWGLSFGTVVGPSSSFAQGLVKVCGPKKRALNFV